MSVTSRHYSQCSQCTDRTMESAYSTIQSAQPQCTAGMQLISETNASATLAE